MIDEELKFYYTPTVMLIENCKDIDNSSIRINNGNALNENLYVVKANGITLLEAIDLKDMYRVNLNKLNTVDIILKNTITGKELPYSINTSFKVENTICKSTLREMRQAVVYSTEKDTTGKIIKVGYTTTYQPGEGVPGKIEFFLNGELKNKLCWRSNKRLKK